MISISLTSLLMHGGYLVFLTAYVLRDILWLRLVAVVGYILFSALAIIRGGPGLVEILPWYVAFLTINGVQVARLVRERWLVKMNADEAALWEGSFASLDPVIFKRFLRLGQWRTLSKGFTLTSEGRRSSRLYLLAGGAVDVALEDRPIARLGAGQFVGEIAFVSASPSTATAIAASEDGTRCVVWNVPKLQAETTRDPELRGVVFSAVGSDLAHKIAEQTVFANRRPDQAPSEKAPSVGI